MQQPIRAAAIGSFALLVLAGCNSGERPADSGKIPVVVSIQPQKWLVEQVGGEHVDVLVLVAPGDDPHAYQPTDAQISQAMRSAVYFRIGVPFEEGPWFRAISGSGKLDVVDTRQGIDAARDGSRHRIRQETTACTRPRHTMHHDHGGRDPHIWTSPRLLKIQAATVARSLSELAPEHGDDFQRNLAALEAKLDEVDAAIREKLAPHSGRAMFVFHPAWGYFADEYGLRQVAVELEGKEPSDHELTELQRLARGGRGHGDLRAAADLRAVGRGGRPNGRGPGRSARPDGRGPDGRTHAVRPTAEDPGRIVTARPEGERRLTWPNRSSNSAT